MKARAIRIPAGELRRLARDDSGVALMLTLAVFLLLYILCCGVYATGELIRQKIEIQNACDAAAYSAAVVQADALSRMAVVNRAMAWTYIQLCREQMDYITYVWLELVCERFKWDRYNKAKLGESWEHKHYTFADYYWDYGAYGAGLRHYGYDKHRNWWYIGVGDGETVAKDCVALNGRNTPDEAVPIDDIEGVLDGADEESIKIYKKGFKEAAGEMIDQAKMLIPSMNATLGIINKKFHESIKATVPYVLFNNLPRTSDGQVDAAMAKECYWTLSGGLSPNPEAYADVLTPGEAEGEDLGGSYFSGLGNTEDDELQFLTMADGIPGRAEGAPGWMKERAVRLSDYFGTDGMKTVEDSDGEQVYMAGGLDQWYVRGTEDEAMSTDWRVEKGEREPPGGIMRVYKHTNREEGATPSKGCLFHRPNHIFSPREVGRLFGPGSLLGDFNFFKNPFSGGVDSDIADLANSLVSSMLQALGGLFGQLGGIIDKLNDFQNEWLSADILPSDRHQPEDFPEQCLHVSSSTGLVAQYEWSSAYWICPWVKWTDFYGTHFKEFGCHRVPVSALLGCDAHGYKPWISRELEILAPRELNKAGATRAEYRSCFINFDDLQDKEKNHYLKGYARIYGDDEEIFDEYYYTGALACPWVLSEAFFSGDGTFLVGLARKQKNPFLRVLAAATGVARPSIYEPFSPQAGSDKYLVALSAARAAWAPRPDKPQTGMESVNVGRPPGIYDPRFDQVTEHKFGLGCPCGEDETQERLLRMWNLSQTDWDATLLPLRHAFDGHTPYDSHVNPPDGSAWEYEDAEERNAVKRLAGLLANVKWVNGLALVASQVPGSLDSGERARLRQEKAPSSAEIMEAPLPTEKDPGERGSLYQMLLYRRLL